MSACKKYYMFSELYRFYSRDQIENVVGVYIIFWKRLSIEPLFKEAQQLSLMNIYMTGFPFT